MLFSFDRDTSKRRHKKTFNSPQSHPGTYGTSNQSKKHLEKNNPCAVLGKKVYADLTKYGKKICAIGGINLNRIKKKQIHQWRITAF